MRIEVRNRVSDFNSYRAARVKSLFNAENGCNFDLTAEIDLEGLDSWTIGVIVGPSGSGKTSIGKKIFGNESYIYEDTQGWPDDKPISDAIAANGDFNSVTGALASVGLGSVPSWLRPFRVLSNGEQFRAGLARMICERPEKTVVDEFTSVIDRQIAKIGAQAFQKAWKRDNGGKFKVVLLTPHYDILDWVEPDWVFDTKDCRFERGCLRRRPQFELEIRKVDASYWRYFKPHYYLDLPMPPAAEYFIGTVDGELACHVAVAPKFETKYYRATRLVTMPEWQGAGVGTKFLNWIGQYHLDGNGRLAKKYPMLFHTSHPQLCAYLRRSPLWVQVSAVLHGDNKKRSAQSIQKSARKKNKHDFIGVGYGGHFRAVQGFKFIGGVLQK
jgi:GNAT superfamily N-acetyltransferase